MNCCKVNNLLSAYMDGELAGVEHIQIQRHLRDCCPCQEEYESLLLTKRLLSGLNLRAPAPDLEDRILERIGGERPVLRPALDPRAWWLVSSERQRQRLRMGVLCGTLCALSLVLATTRISQSVRPAVGLGGQGAADLAFVRGSTPPPYGPPPAPPAGFLQAHSSWADAQPFGPGVSVQAASSTEQSGAYLVPVPESRRP